MLSPMVRCTYHVAGGGSRRYPRKLLRSLVGRGWALVEEPMPLHRRVHPSAAVCSSFPLAGERGAVVAFSSGLMLNRSGRERGRIASEYTHVRGPADRGGPPPVRPSLLRRFPHHPIVVLGVLVVVLGFDGVSGQGGSTREFHVLRVARLGVDTSIRLLPGRP